MRRFGRIALVGGLAAAIALPASTAGATASTVTVTVAVSGLNAPKHLLTYGDGLFYVESGTGGKAGKSNCVSGASLEGSGTTQYCEGHTGSIGVLSSGSGSAFAGLPSVVEKDDGEVAGPGAVAFSASGEAAIVFQDELVAKDGSNSLPAPASTTFGTLELLHDNTATFANLAAFAAAHPQPKSALGSSGQTAYDSDPYDVAAYKSGFVVADAAANSLLQVTSAGTVSILARFPYVPETIPPGSPGNPGSKPVTVDAQAVPTSVAVGPDGALYVGLLRGGPSQPGTADIYRVDPGTKATIWASGLTAVTAIAFDKSGRLLATEYSTGGLTAPPTTPGALVRISKDGSTVTTLPVSGLYQPTGVAVTSSGTVYVSNYGASTSKSSQPGQLLEITGL